MDICNSRRKRSVKGKDQQEKGEGNGSLNVLIIKTYDH